MLLDLLAVDEDERGFRERRGATGSSRGGHFRPPQAIFPRYVEPAERRSA